MVLKYGLPGLAGVALALAVTSVRQMTPKETPVAPPQAPPTAPYAGPVGATGLVEASSENIAIGTAEGGLVVEVRVRPGDRVRAGQALFRLDGRHLEAERKLRESALALAEARLERLRKGPRPEEVPLAQARVDEARAQLEDARTQLKLMEAVADRRAIRLEDLEKRRQSAEAAAARLREAEAALALLKAGSWEQDVRVAEAEAQQARRQVERVEADLSRLTVTAPAAGRILQVNIRAGEYAGLAREGEPLMLMGSDTPLHVRVEVDDRDAWRVRPGAAAVGSLRGNTSQQYALRFVRVEPYVVPKRNLTGEARERTDTRVLQVIYALPEGAPVYAGQQMEVFIESGEGGR